MPSSGVFGDNADCESAVVEKMSEQVETKLVALEIKVDLLEQQLAMHEAALMKVGAFIEAIGRAAIEANKPEE